MVESGLKTEMKLKLSIAHQAIALAIIPLLFELVFVTILIVVLVDAEREIAGQFRFRSITDHISTLQRRTVDATTFYTLHTMFGGQGLEDRINKATTKLQLEIAELEELNKREPELAIPFSQLRNSMQKFIEVCCQESGKKRDKQEDREAFDRDRIPYDRQLLDSVSPSLQRYYDKLLQLEREREKTTDLVIQHLNVVVKKGLLISIILSALLAYIFSRRIAYRLSILSKNASRVAQHQPLHPPVRGADELAALDRVFHDMAEDLNRVDSQKKQLLTLISERLNAPLQRALKYLLLAQQVDQNSEQIRKKLKPLRGNILRLCSLIEDLLDIENIDSGKMELSVRPCQLADIIDSALSAVQGYINRKKLQIQIDDSEAIINGDALKLEQVLINLLGNAIKFSPNEETIQINISQDMDSQITIAVIDHGPGIPPDKIGLLFERFRQTNPQADTQIGGSGLGLSICKKIVEAHGGTIGVSSKPNSGSRFWITLPYGKLSGEKLS